MQEDSRRTASDLFPSLDSSLKRKKDHGMNSWELPVINSFHCDFMSLLWCSRRGISLCSAAAAGRAEALLIAAYGRSLKLH